MIEGSEVTAMSGVNMGNVVTGTSVVRSMESGVSVENLVNAGIRATRNLVNRTRKNN